MRSPAYPSYKPSGVKWLGDIPEKWEVKKLKYIANRRTKKSKADEENSLPYVGLENIESWTGQLLPLDPEFHPTEISNIFKAGDTLFGKLRPYLAKACNVDFDGLCTSEIVVLHPTNQNRQFLLYCLLTPGFISLVNSSSFGVKMPRAEWDFIGACPLSLPRRQEQDSIALFLDHKTAKIDALISRKRTLIEKLNEKRIALISRTVTQGLPPETACAAGLHPNPKLKQSEIPWIGEVPEHWKVTRLGYLTSKIGSGKTPKGGAETYQSEGVLLIRSQNVYDSGLKISDAVFIDDSIDEEMANTRVLSEDVLLNITGASLGRSTIVPNNFPRANVNQHVCIIRVQKTKVCPRFLQRVISSNGLQSQIFSFENGSSREGLNFHQIRCLLMAIPDLPEQIAIANFLDCEAMKIDQMIKKVNSAIEKLQEYRTSLITAAVTGKIDVRGVTA